MVTFPEDDRPAPLGAVATAARRRPGDPIPAAAQAWIDHGWQVGPHFLAALSILRVEVLIARSNEAALKPHQLTHVRHEALALLYFSRQGQLPLGKMSRRLLVHPTSITSVIDTLERLGLVERRAHDSDRRTTLACITAKGRAAIEASCLAITSNRSALGVLSERQAQAVFTTLRPVRAAAGDVTATDGSPPGDASTGAGPPDPVEAASEHWSRHGWPVGPHFLAALSIVRVEQLIRRSNSAALDPHRLTHSRHEALAVLHFSRNGQLPLGKLSQRLMVHPTSVTSTIDALERLGYVERTPHPTDRRATLARITDLGRAAMDDSCRTMAAARFGLEALSEDQANRLFTTLRHVRADAGDLHAGRNAR